MMLDHAEPEREEQRVGQRWLVRLRWGAIASELAAIAVARGLLGIELPLAPMLGVVSIGAASNVLLSRMKGDHLAGAMATALLSDVAALTALLYFGGGSSNPFSAVYLVYITLGAVLLAPRPTAALVLAAAVGYGLLFVAPSPMEGAHAHHHHGGGELFSAHLYGMYVALVVSAVLVGYFVSRLSSAVRLREAELRAARAQAADAERLAALTTLCAGAAHELGTPLATIALAASELARVAGASGGARLVEDAELIRAEVDRCRAILDRMAARFGESVGERPERVETERLFEAVRALLPERERGRVAFEAAASSAFLPVGAVAQAITNLVENALDAGAGPVSVRAAHVGRELALSVRDEAGGMSPEVLARAADPFFTTKDAGHGMGLGLYLCRVTAQRLGGRLELRSVLGQGTEAVLALPEPEARA